MIPEEQINNKRLVIKERVKGVDLSINKLLTLANEASAGLKSTLHYRKEGVNNYSEVLTRKGEKFKSWLNPRGTGGVGSNILEFLNVLYEDTDKEELGEHLLIRHRYGPKIIGFKVFPGQLLLNTVTILAGIEKHKKKGGGGQLVLEDIEKHFEKYGIDFGKANDARPTLINQLKAMGLLSGSPDAGGSVAVICPYT